MFLGYIHIWPSMGSRTQSDNLPRGPYGMRGCEDFVPWDDIWGYGIWDGEGLGDNDCPPIDSFIMVRRVRLIYDEIEGIMWVS